MTVLLDQPRASDARDQAAAVLAAFIDPVGRLRAGEPQTAELCLAAVLRDGRSIAFVTNQTAGLCQAALAQTARALQDIREPTADLCQMAVDEKPWAIRFVPQALQTESLSAQAVDAALRDGIAAAQALQSIKDPALRLRLAERYGVDAPAPAVPVVTVRALADATPDPAASNAARVNGYANDKSWALNAALTSDARAHTLVAEWCAKQGGGAVRLTAEAAAALFKPSVLARLRISVSGAPGDEIVWTDIAEGMSVPTTHRPRRRSHRRHPTALLVPPRPLQRSRRERSPRM